MRPSKGHGEEVKMETDSASEEAGPATASDRHSTAGCQEESLQLHTTSLVKCITGNQYNHPVTTSAHMGVLGTLYIEFQAFEKYVVFFYNTWQGKNRL